ncbi:PepSY domain-containing protein [Streptomyces sp. SID7909]|uniref:PepSY domain-containing protein n=1 Tax=Streptomyces sp. SID7909 TaxID=2706092 RepID=UPI0013BE480B|nr:PepSY domain-containing protein [Streptomyces sp. SID7909]NEC06987.1 PepSY domain-containing protein [Streptomyces sp. SID7909]
MKRKIVIGVVTAVLIGGGAAGAAVAVGGDDDRAAPVRVPAGAKAMAKAVPGTVTEAELDEEDGRLVWELEVYGSDKVWHDVTVDAESGKVVGSRVDRDEDGRGAPRGGVVSLDEAVRAATGG